MKRRYMLLLLIPFFASCATDHISIQTKDTDDMRNGSVYWVETTEIDTTERVPLSLKSGYAENADIVISLDKEGQEISGFGGSFNEAGWDALSALAPEDREEVLQNIFDEEGEGLRLNLARMPIGSSDYALTWYSHNETPGDYAMEDFSIHRDYEYLIPYIKAAMVYNPDLPIWASAWSPPSWMKNNEDFDSGHMLYDSQIYRAYALYLAKFVEAYQAEGIDIFEVAVQNEPKILTPYPSCEWEPEQFAEFVKYHLGPVFRDRNVDAGIMLGTFNYGNEFQTFIKPLLEDPQIASYVTSVGFQWNGDRAVRNTAESFPGVMLVQTETECGNWSWNGRWNREIPGYEHDPQKPQNDYAYAAYTWNRIRDYFREGVNSYYLWNIVLDDLGYNNNEQVPWPQNAAVVIDRSTGEAEYTPMFWSFWHYSHFIEPGAVYIPVDRVYADAVVFRNPDGTIVIETCNPREEYRTVTIQLEDAYFNVRLAPESFQTFRVKVSE